VLVLGDDRKGGIGNLHLTWDMPIFVTESHADSSAKIRLCHSACLGLSLRR
jgi:hypothetical protein